jgi:hypothetical protein
MCLATARTFLVSYFYLLIVVSPALAFDDDSRDDTRSSSFNTFCENNQVLNDTPSLKSSCQGDLVHLQDRNATLVKNRKKIARLPVLDFKVSRSGKVYYRSQNGPFLSDESGRLNSLGAVVVIYLVSTRGDVVYLNDQGVVFKNGHPLNKTHGKVLFQIKKTSGGRFFSAPDLAISRKGQAIYITDMGQLYVDQVQMSAHTAKVLNFKVDSKTTVFYLDDLGRLFKNKNRVSTKHVRVKQFRLNAKGQIAYLTDGNSKNLFFEDRNLSAGSHRILNFSFTGNGEVIYKDDGGRLWQMGRLIRN